MPPRASEVVTAGEGRLIPGDGPAVEAPVVHGVHVVEEVDHPDDGLSAVLGEEGRVGEQLGDPPAGASDVESRQAEGSDFDAVDDDVDRCGFAGHGDPSSWVLRAAACPAGSV